MGTPNLNHALAVTLRLHRRARGLSQEQLAALAGLHRTYVSQLERGLKSPSLNRLSDLAGALRAPLEKLVADVVEEHGRRGGDQADG